jgi:TPP-dependent pyruvate/acetoin dehydrogenase alpha subunit
VSRALESDPLTLAAKAIPAEEARKIREEAEDEVKRALDVAAAAPWPPAVEAYKDVQDTGSDQWR